MTKIKICGLTKAADIQAVNQYQPDYVGFVFAPSRRCIQLSEAEALKKMLCPKVQTVGVYVNAPWSEILSAVSSNVIDVIQLHGEEHGDYIEELKFHTSLPIIKAVRVSSPWDILAAAQLPCDYLLLDSFVRGVQGGSGQRFAWSMIPTIDKPFFLAGGLSMDNLSQAASTGAYGLDLSSAAETNGVKDPSKIRDIIKKIRSINLCQKEDLDNTADNLYQKR